jgi:hypothetical protein
MNGLREVLRDREEGIVEQWVTDTLAAYPDEGARAFARERDRFANPVGHSVRVGIRAIVTALLEGDGDEAITRALNDILQIRAVQQLAPAAAVGFLFHLKQLIRDALGAENGRFASELADLDRRIDQAALTAFDLYVTYRELVYELRLNEAKRAIPWTTRKVSRE